MARDVGRRGNFVRRHAYSLAAPFVYVACSVWLYWPLVRHLRSAQMGGPDTALFTWWLGWTPWAILHGHSPLLSTWVNAPDGVNAMWNTSVPLLGVLMSPITLTIGPVATVNLLLILCAPLSALSAYAGARLLGLRSRSAFLVGFLYGFSTYVLAQGASGHLHLAMAVFPPLVTALLYRVFTGATSPRTGGLLIGLAGVLQVWISEEILATAGVVVVLVLAVLAVRVPRERVAPAARLLLRTSLWTLVVVVPLASPALYVQFLGAGHLSSGVNIPAISSDVFTSVTPTIQVAVHYLIPDRAIRRIQVNNFDEVTGYLGLPVLLLLVVSRRRIRATPLRWCWTPLVVAAVLALGWTIRIAGFSTHLRGPGWLLNHLPLLESIVAVRFSVYVVLFAALLVGAAWDSAAGARTTKLVTGLVALAVVAVFPWPSANITRISVPAAFSSARPLPGLADGATVAILPWPSTANDDAMRWQVVNRFHFRLVGAYGIVRGVNGEGDYGSPKPELDRVAYRMSHYLSGPPASGSKGERQLLADLATIRREAGALVIGPYGHPTGQRLVAAYVAGLLHEQPVFTGGIYVFRSPSG
ncbi:hypothetical protein acdb102_29350 [Acidothermaceae bacterium B102]|nr:hypothetical protein acdb102_29350 [Acidothermaceae bacterium B102]